MAVTGSAQSEAYKALFNKAYGQAAELAKESKGDPVIARTLMQKLGYTRDELRTAGDDVARMQGVQSPHPRARIQPGEHVLDLGCGLGVDALIAAAAAGPGGRVCGVDLAEKEVLHARGAHAARLARRTSGGASLAPTSYHVGDMEALPFPDASFDVVISNGGFCLVPDKARAFAEVCRVLKPGGRCAIACTVNKADLDPSVKWPACMEVFMTVGDAPRLVGGAGLVDLAVTTDRTGGRMDVFDIDVDQVANEIAQSAATDSNGSSSSSSSSSAGEFGEGEETLYANAEAAEDAEIAALEAAVAEAKSSCSHAVAAAERRLNEAAERIAGERQQRQRARAEADAEIAKLEAEASRLAAAEGTGAGCSHATKAAERRLREAIGRRERKAAAKVGVHWGDPDFDHLHTMDINQVSARVVIVAAKPLSGGDGGGAKVVAHSPATATAGGAADHTTFLSLPWQRAAAAADAPSSSSSCLKLPLPPSLSALPRGSPSGTSSSGALLGPCLGLGLSAASASATVVVVAVAAATAVGATARRQPRLAAAVAGRFFSF